MKKVKCIDNNGAEELSLEKTYYVKKEDGAFYTVSVKEGTMASYLKWRFEEIKSKDELNIIEASNMPLGTKFQILYPNGTIDNWNCMVTKSGVGNVLSWIHNDTSIGGTQNIINAKFISIKQKPVSFMDIVDSNKKCKVEHELITDLLNSDITLKEFDNDELEYKWFMEYKNKGYLQINLLMDIVMGFLNAREYKTVIKEGKWYLSDEEDIDI